MQVNDIKHLIEVLASNKYHKNVNNTYIYIYIYIFVCLCIWPARGISDLQCSPMGFLVVACGI